MSKQIETQARHSQFFVVFAQDITFFTILSILIRPIITKIAQGVCAVLTTVLHLLPLQAPSRVLHDKASPQPKAAKC